MLYNPAAVDFPINLKLDGRRALVVGGGPIAYRKAQALAQAGAEVVVVAPRIDARFRRFRKLQRTFKPSDVDGACLVVAATDDATVNRQVFRACARKQLPVNVVDVPDLCTFTMPATFRRGGLTVSFSTNGGSPALARELRLRLERIYPKQLGAVLRSLAQARASMPASAERRHLMKRLARAAVRR